MTARVVSLPCFELFDQQPREYQLATLPDGAPIISVEAYSTVGWAKYSHEQIGINSFGASGPFKDVYKKFGITGENVAAKAQEVLKFYHGDKLRSPLNKALAA